jgi:hypothetical protein
MDRGDAERVLTAAVAERDALRVAAERARERLYEVVREVAPVLRQVEIVKATGWTREHVRKIVRPTPSA